MEEENMPNNESQSPNKEDLKEVEYYAIQANAWISTRMERDKTLLTLSAGGIGLLVTLLTTKGVESICAFALYALAILAFVLCLGSLIAIFSFNSGYIEKVMQGDIKRSKYLSALDYFTLTSFCVGVLLSLTLGLTTGIESLQAKRTESMRNQKIEKKESLERSLNNISVIDPRQSQQQQQQGSQENSQVEQPSDSDKK